MKPTPAHRPPQANHLLVLALTSVLSFAGLGRSAAAAGPGGVPPIPDLTRGGTKDDTHDWNLGPTGIRGWVYGCKGDTADARQILVTTLAKGSPADGILNSGDVILGVGGGNFSGDARIQFANAITAAEQEKNGGLLRLVRWRDGQSTNVELKLPVLGAYSDTAPYDCPKSKKILELGCQAIVKAGLEQANIPNHLNALALLASGNKKYRPMLADYAPKAAASLRPGTWTWFYGYGNLFLAEYVLATGDLSILPESQTLPELGPEARKASVSDLLAMTVRANPADPRRMAQRAACTALFTPYPGSRTPRSSILSASLEGVDRELLYPAVRSVLENDDGAARGSLQRIYGKLTDGDLVALLPEIVKAVRDLAPSNEMFGDDIRLAGLDLVSRLRLREGMPLCLSVVELKRWGDGRRLEKGMECLARYGVHAKAVLPELREMRRSLKDNDKNAILLDKAIAGIEAATDSPTLVDLKDFTTRP